MSGFEDAAIAFDKDLGNAPAPKSGGVRESAGPETMFENLGNLEIDEDSPAEGGGDRVPVRVGKQSPKPKEQADEEEEERLDGEYYPDEDDDGVHGKDDEPDEKDDPDEDEQGDDDEGQLYEVTIDGEKKQVPLKEALQGYIRQETFHQRLNDLETVKNAMRTEAAETSAARAAYIKQINEFKKYSDALIPAEPNWDEEYAKDPVNARALQKRYEQMKGVKANLDAEASRVQKEQKDADIKVYNTWVAEENARIAANNPRWADEKVAKKDLTDMMGTALASRFTEEEVLSIRDSRMIAVLLKAAKYDRIMSKKPMPVNRGGKAVNSGVVNASTRSAPPRGKQALDRLAKTGSVEAAGDFFTNLITRRK